MEWDKDTSVENPFEAELLACYMGDGDDSNFYIPTYSNEIFARATKVNVEVLDEYVGSYLGDYNTSLIYFIWTYIRVVYCYNKYGFCQSNIQLWRICFNFSR